MEHKGIEYTIRARGPNEWTWTIYPKQGRPREGQVTGSRERAEKAAIDAIDTWLKSNPTKKA